MSIASERKRFREALAGYSLINTETAAKMADVHPDEIRRASERGGTLASITVGRELRFDPIDVCSWRLTGRSEPEPSDETIQTAATWLRERVPGSWPIEEEELAPQGFVYVIATTELPHRIKVGFTGDPAGRLITLQAMSPVGLEMVRYRPGTVADERRLHALFAESRLHGEWFDGGALPAVLEEMGDVA